MEEILVLRTDGRDEVVDARHLNHGEHGDKPEPRGLDLFACGVTVQGAPNTRFLVLLVFPFRSLAVGRCLEERVDLANDGVATNTMLTSSSL